MPVLVKLYVKACICNFLFLALFAVQGCSKNTHPKPSPVVVTPEETSFSISNILQSNMVIQRDQPLAIWGSSKPGLIVNISVSWHTQKFNATADAGGKWKAIIPPSTAKSLPQTITVTANEIKPITFNNILIGDVWLCAGQSNMVMPLAPNGGSFAGVTNYESEIAAANYPLIRATTIKENYQWLPADTLSRAAVWNACTPATTAVTSAVAYYFARKIHTEINVPIGIIVAAVGGTKCEQWANKEVFTDATISGMYGDGTGDSQLYNGMINPFTNLSVKGFIWYQGESNWSDSPAGYAKLNAGLIKGWRSKFNNPAAPFYFVQLAPFSKNQHTLPGGGDLTLFDYALFREGQKEILQLVDNTDMAISMDVGSIFLLHPPGKKPIGERLALFALKNDYSKPVNPICPRYKSHVQTGNSITIQFDNANGLTTIGGHPLNQHFYVAGSNRIFINVNAVIKNNAIVLTLPNTIGSVQAIRYAFTNAAVTNLTNNEGLPVEQFRTDNW
ncbi:hypothetical protein DJ568_07280 [Mucilaginibacter hurinus]|uniref:Sialate O-acetylesterase domain-containing protein n=1 Tax=Mucilaginibacter hurinus TaxID=2201324 RepID=A0A367GQZ8_9SPHI|nr:sialate O-acetylesterase [Mucilaginibacter hurinus]RCH55680.1 hypothetical protein DJ568_07280 [Mucilaginibacter hurinus]